MTTECAAGKAINPSNKDWVPPNTAYRRQELAPVRERPQLVVTTLAERGALRRDVLAAMEKAGEWTTPTRLVDFGLPYGIDVIGTACRALARDGAIASREAAHGATWYGLKKFSDKPLTQATAAATAARRVKRVARSSGGDLQQEAKPAGTRAAQGPEGDHQVAEQPQEVAVSKAEDMSVSTALAQMEQAMRGHQVEDFDRKDEALAGLAKLAPEPLAAVLEEIRADLKAMRGAA